jgi:hypothetical protein
MTALVEDWTEYVDSSSKSEIALVKVIRRAAVESDEDFTNRI